MIDKFADQEKFFGTLSNMNSDILVKVPFKRKYSHLFNMFDERERIEIIESILSVEINFETLMASNVILYHGPLHKKNDFAEELKVIYNTDKYKLFRTFVYGNFLEHFELLNMIKSFHGEKCAFEFAFLLHY